MTHGKRRVALVTGASRNIGRSIAQALAAANCAVVCLGRDRAALEETAALITGAGGEASVFVGDVASNVDLKACVAHTVATFGGLWRRRRSRARRGGRWHGGCRLARREEGFTKHALCIVPRRCDQRVTKARQAGDAASSRLLTARAGSRRDNSSGTSSRAWLSMRLTLT